jgi:hypothetical protein
MNKLVCKTLTQIAKEFGVEQKTISAHIDKYEDLKEEIKPGLQFPLHQKKIYDKLGYPPCVNKKDYEHV